MLEKFDKFTLAYMECALWSTMDDEGEPLDSKYDFDDFADETLVIIQADCKKFQEENAKDIDEGYIRSNIGADISDSEYAGHDFWLTRNGHGAGFWDGDWEKSVGERLTKAAQAFGETWLYVGDDGKLYFG